MADIEHVDLTDPDIHEPKGITGASSATVYVANGAGTGSWQKVTVNTLDYSALLTALQNDINDGDIDLNGVYFLTAALPDVSSPSSVIIPIRRASTVTGATLVLGGAITVADATVTLLNSSGASMGPSVTVGFTGSAKGDTDSFTATGNNIISAGSWIEISTDGASSTSQPLYVTVQLSAILN